MQDLARKLGCETVVVGRGYDAFARVLECEGVRSVFPHTRELEMYTN